jgi:Arc/MetJ family transcription regulator
MRTVIDVDDELLTIAAAELGTTSKKDTVNAALRFVAQRRQRATAAVEDTFYRFGVGPDIADPEVMKGARR